MKKWWTQDIQGQGQAESHEQILIFRVSTPKVKSKGWTKKGKGRRDTEAEEDYVKMEFFLLNKEAEMHLTRLMIQMGAVQKVGPAPPTKEIRIIKDPLRDMR